MNANIDNRRIAIMMGKPIKENLVRPESNEIMSPGQIKTCKELYGHYSKSPSSTLQRRGAREAALDPHLTK
jgi:hypothetical protein